MSSVTIQSTALISVPAPLWPRWRAILQAIHRQRRKDYGDQFVTHSAACNVRACCDNTAVMANVPLTKWLMQVRLDLPPNFTGEIIFQVAA